MAIQAVQAILLLSTLLLLEIILVQAGFKVRVFRGNEQHILEGLSARERLRVAAKYGTSHIVELTSSSQAAVSQQGANINLDCLPWRNVSSQPQNGTIQWKFIQLDEFGNPANPAMTPLIIAPNAGVEPQARIVVGGLFNRWLNITRVINPLLDYDSDSKIFICEVCVAHGTPSEQCNTANFTLFLVGAPPIIRENLTSTCLSRDGDKVAAVLECDYVEEPYPLPSPQRSWYKDDELVYSALVGNSPNASEFFAANPLLAMGVLNPPPIHILSDGSILLSNQVENITLPSLLPPGTTLEQVKEQLYALLLGNWTCKLNNTLGNASHTHMIRECIPRSSIPVPEVEGLCSIVVWKSGLSDSAVSCEDIIGYDVRLYHPESKHRNLTRRVEMDRTYYKISDEDKDAKINHETRIQVRVVHKYAAGKWNNKGAPLGCDKPVETPSGMFFEINNKVYLNNSAIRLRDIGEGERALLCKTDRRDCCGTPPNRYGEFYYPNGVSVPIASRQQGFYRNRGEQVIRLNRRSTATTLTGKYRCAIPGVDGEVQSIYVTLTV